MTGTDFEVLPDEIGRLRFLQKLVVKGNLRRLPSAIGSLKSLRTLQLSGCGVRELPPEIGSLSQMVELFLGRNELETLPPEIGQLQCLQFLGLNANRLTRLPPEVGQLGNLVELHLRSNQLTELPPEIGEMVRLRRLSLSENLLTKLPEEISQLADLETLALDSNKLRTLPPELGRLSRLSDLQILDNPIEDPPPPILAKGRAGITEYLRARDIGTVRQWISKLVVVGQGGVGKTCLLRALRSEPYRESETTTHGIEVRGLTLKHPSKPGVDMTLNAWDFGGQEIYHATHQFFLSNRSLFLVVWNARQGFEQSRLYYWLDTIHSLAPESPILLVATQVDERDADLPLEELRLRYPQVRGLHTVSSKTSKGIRELRSAIAKEASQLPLMGQPWPTDWRKAAEELRKSEEPYISSFTFKKRLIASGVRAQAVTVLGSWLHELGDILYFHGSPDLEDTVILKPTWATGIVSRILESEEVIKSNGVLTSRHMRKLWNDLDNATQHFCLRLMERFDLSYRTLGDRDISIVVERLPFQPAAYREKWASLIGPDAAQVSMRFVLGATMPAGVPTWFIARQHRFSIGLHWRTGVLLADGEQKHLALLEAFPHDRHITLSVRGSFPQNFFSLLRDGLELTLDRFPGLPVERRVPCPGHGGQPCTHEFLYSNLLRAISRKPPKPFLECPVGLEDVPVPRLLFGIHSSSHDEVISGIRRLAAQQKANQTELVVLLSEQTELIQREFTSAFRALQGNVDLACPNVFIFQETKRGIAQTLSGPQGKSLNDSSRSVLDWPLVELHLLCQKPGAWHPTTDGGHYTFGRPPEWFREAVPIIQRMLDCLKVCPVPKIKAGAEVASAAAAWKQNLKFTEDVVKLLGEGAAIDTVEGGGDSPEPINGAALRAIRRLLEQLDSDRQWGDLRKILTPEGHWLWLCPEHASAYRR